MTGNLTKEQRDRLRRRREHLEREEQMERDQRSQPFLELPLPIPREAPRRIEEESGGTVIIIDMN